MSHIIQDCWQPYDQITANDKKLDPARCCYSLNSHSFPEMLKVYGIFPEVHPTCEDQAQNSYLPFHNPEDRSDGSSNPWSPVMSLTWFIDFQMTETALWSSSFKTPSCWLGWLPLAKYLYNSGQISKTSFPTVWYWKGFPANATIIFYNDKAIFIFTTSLPRTASCRTCNLFVLFCSIIMLSPRFKVLLTVIWHFLTLAHYAYAYCCMMQIYSIAYEEDDSLFSL